MVYKNRRFRFIEFHIKGHLNAISLNYDTHEPYIHTHNEGHFTMKSVGKLSTVQAFVFYPLFYAMHRQADFKDMCSNNGKIHCIDLVRVSLKVFQKEIN